MKIIGHFQGSWGGNPLFNELLPAFEKSGMDAKKLKKSSMLLHVEDEQVGVLEWITLAETEKELELAGRLILMIIKNHLKLEEDPVDFFLRKFIPILRENFKDNLTTYSQKADRYNWEERYSNENSAHKMTLTKLPVFEKEIVILLEETEEKIKNILKDRNEK